MKSYIKYIHFRCDADELEDQLNLYGQEGFGLHTCDPYTRQGKDGVSGMVQAFVVMQKTVYGEEITDAENDVSSEGMPMKG